MNEPLEPRLSKHGAVEALSFFPRFLIDMLAEPLQAAPLREAGALSELTGSPPPRPCAQALGVGTLGLGCPEGPQKHGDHQL